MTKFIFVRHGESPGNDEGRFYGHYDKGLTELGKKQADAVGEYLKDYRFDAAYASDLERAFDTGRRIVKFHSGLELIPNDKLREIYAGKWENVRFSDLDLLYHNDYQTWMTDLWNARPTEGESVAELTYRIKNEIWSLAEKHDGQTVLIATHSTPIRTMLCEWKGMPYEDITSLGWVKNCSVTEVNYDIINRKSELILLGETCFLGDMATELPKDV